MRKPASPRRFDSAYDKRSSPGKGASSFGPSDRIRTCGRADAGVMARPCGKWPHSLAADAATARGCHRMPHVLSGFWLKEKKPPKGGSFSLIRVTGFEPAASSAAPPGCGARNSQLAIRCAEFRPLPRSILPLSAPGGGRMLRPKQACRQLCSGCHSTNRGTKQKKRDPYMGSLFFWSE